MNVFVCLFSILLVVASAIPSDIRQNNDEVKDLKNLITKLTTKLDSITQLTAKVNANSIKLDSITQLTAKVNANSIKLDTITQLATNVNADPITQLTAKVNVISKKLDSYTEYCSIMATGTCGSCLCKDDRRLLKKYYCDCSEMEPKRDCLEFYQQGARIDGVYKIHQGMGKIIQVYCDQTTDGGGWTVFQRRNGDASVDFYRSWVEYKKGFGDLQHEFWLGNQNLYTLSLEGLCLSGNELRVDLESVSGSRTYAKYSNFEVGSEFTKYELNVGGYSGDASDQLTYHNNMKFTSYDRDNDKYSAGNCALIYKSGWWYNSCHSAHLNGRYLFYGDKKTDNNGGGVLWRDQTKFAQMKIRRKTV